MAKEKVTYDEWITWDEKIWRSRLNTYDYPADYEDDWLEPEDSLPTVPYVRVVEPPGPHWLANVRRNHFNEFNNFLKTGKKWILVDPFVVGDTAGRWIVLGKFFHKTAFYFGITSLLICLISPEKRYCYSSATSVSVFTALGYILYTMDPISNYQVENDKLELSRFPMKSFYPRKPFVFRRLENRYSEMFHCFVSAASLCCTLYYISRPPPFCYCGWGNLDKFKPELKIK